MKKNRPFKMHSLKDSLNNILAGAGSMMDIYGVGSLDHRGELRRRIEESIKSERLKTTAEEIMGTVLRMLIEYVHSGGEISYKKGDKAFRLISVEKD